MRACIIAVILLSQLANLDGQPRGPLGPAAYPPDLLPAHREVAYASASASQRLDLFLPPGEGPFPLVLNLHGGAFRFGSKEMLDAPIARALLAAGYAVASVNYRLSGEARFPAAIQDVKAAVRHLRAHAGEYQLDGRVVAFGQSAGGNLASLLGASGGEERFEDASLGNSGVSSRVQGVIDWFGPTDFLQMDRQAAEQGCPASSQSHGTAQSPESRYLGAPVAEVPDLAKLANPITFITADDPPFLIQKGTKDCMVPVGQSRLLAEALRAAKVPVELDLLENAGHGDTGTGAPRFLSEANIERVVRFVAKTMPLQD